MSRWEGGGRGCERKVEEGYKSELNHKRGKRGDDGQLDVGGGHFTAKYNRRLDNTAVSSVILTPVSLPKLRFCKRQKPPQVSIRFHFRCCTRFTLTSTYPPRFDGIIQPSK